MSGQHYSYITYHQTELYFQKFGTGKKVLLAFHGYGENSDTFKKIGEVLGEQYTIYSFDLFFHGKSKWPFGSKVLKKEFWLALIRHFLDSENIDRFSMAGYSMGSKFLLTILEAHATRIDDIFFIAPDGIATNTWYRLATYPMFLRRVFKLTVRFPKPLFAFMQLMLKLKIVDKGVIKFAKSEMNSPVKRKRVYDSWIVFRHLSFDMAVIAGLINRHQIPIKMILGKYDKIMTPEGMQALLNKVTDHELIVLETSHNRLPDAFAKYLQTQ
ncbi:alpha/beta hydrolase [Fulvivirgaceae bacterium BMA12]|uniref:Alpha/beta hydrolase n=1 Tax=Agaribacillus aureus TaxID=3051825 RepID=A0ABT8L1A5_9BACT|nr:alpha/beta hydrolase [Fulvivirgaceae bacterium BMA12]